MKEYLLATLPFVIGIPLAVFIWASIERRKHPPSPDARETLALWADRRWLPSGWASLAFAFVYMGVYSIRRSVPLPGGIKLALLGIPVITLAWFIYTFEREVRSGDEMAKRIHVDALSRTFSIFLGFAMAMWLQNEIWPTPRRSTFELALGFLPLFYFAGLFGAKARYLPEMRSNRENS